MMSKIYYFYAKNLFVWLKYRMYFLIHFSKWYKFDINIIIFHKKRHNILRKNKFYFFELCKSIKKCLQSISYLCNNAKKVFQQNCLWELYKIIIFCYFFNDIMTFIMLFYIIKKNGS